MSALRWDAVTIDARDPAALAVFWCGLLGVGVRGTWEQYVGLEPVAPGQPRVVLQRTDDPRPAKSSAHLDLHVSSVDELAGEVERAVGLGARVVEQVEQQGQRWVVMADPEGNLFCLVAD
ncbi:MAG: glyoxalase/bleomycin resistance protein/dioxygenase [Frankiales bacterium]|jgi:catechol 2,3-dioxygenase-like lactoylglutathione lyase family enzyme|nr:glyoxalase/bleomycin resistance protein/dioxygenase [Frankiales bacterium]